MCIRDRVEEGIRIFLTGGMALPPRVRCGPPGLSLIHISEPTRLGMISYAVFCLKKKQQQSRSTLYRSSSASDVYNRHGGGRDPDFPDRRHGPPSPGTVRPSRPVSYTHLRAHETRHDLVCRLLLEKKTATIEINLVSFVVCIRCV